MKKDRTNKHLQQEALKKHPFGVPDGYFESFGERLQQRIREEESKKVPVRRISPSRRWVALAAAVLGAALITTTLIRFAGSGTDANDLYPDMAVLEHFEVFEDDLYLYELMEAESEELDEDELFANEAIDYLAMNDVEMVILFE